MYSNEIQTAIESKMAQQTNRNIKFKKESNIHLYSVAVFCKKEESQPEQFESFDLVVVLEKLADKEPMTGKSLGFIQKIPIFLCRVMFYTHTNFTHLYIV